MSFVSFLALFCDRKYCVSNFHTYACTRIRLARYYFFKPTSTAEGRRNGQMAVDDCQESYWMYSAALWDHRDGRSLRIGSSRRSKCRGNAELKHFHSMWRQRDKVMGLAASTQVLSGCRVDFLFVIDVLRDIDIFIVQHERNIRHYFRNNISFSLESLSLSLSLAFLQRVKMHANADDRGI